MFHIPEREKKSRGWFGISAESSKNPDPKTRNSVSFRFVDDKDQYISGIKLLYKDWRNVGGKRYIGLAGMQKSANAISTSDFPTHNPDIFQNKSWVCEFFLAGYLYRRILFF